MAVCCTRHGCHCTGQWRLLVLAWQASYLGSATCKALASCRAATQQQQQQQQVVVVAGLQTWRGSCRRGWSGRGKGKGSARGRGSLPASLSRPALVQLQGSFLQQQQQVVVVVVVSCPSQQRQHQRVGCRVQAVCPHGPGGSALGQLELQLLARTPQACEPSWKTSRL
jgi:hypothetical protein